jgi:5-methylcytosine-specific restriction endonuclease McrA
MADVAALITELIQAGTDPALVGRVAAAFAEREAIPVLVRDEAAERRRQKDRDRKELLTANWPEIRQAVIERDGHVCGYCHRAADPVHIDHVVPLSRGGDNSLDNLIVACDRCNISKGNLTPSEWEARCNG